MKKINLINNINLICNIKLFSTIFPYYYNLIIINIKFINNYQFKFNLILKWVFIYFFVSFKTIIWNIDFKLTFDLILTMQINSFLPWVNTKLWVNFILYQLYLVKTKKKQLNFIKRNYRQIKFFLYLFKYFRVFLNLKFSSLKSLSLLMKGRAGNIKWVKVRYLNTQNIKYSKYITKFVFCSHINIFTTKWGSTSVRLQSNYYYLQ